MALSDFYEVSNWREAYYWRLLIQKTNDQYPNLYSGIQIDAPEANDTVGDFCGDRYLEQDKLEKLKNRLSKVEISEIKKRAEEWRPTPLPAIPSIDEVVKSFLSSKDDLKNGVTSRAQDRVTSDKMGTFFLLWKSLGPTGAHDNLTAFSRVSNTYEPVSSLQLRRRFLLPARVPESVGEHLPDTRVVGLGLASRF